MCIEIKIHEKSRITVPFGTYNHQIKASAFLSNQRMKNLMDNRSFELELVHSIADKFVAQHGTLINTEPLLEDEEKRIQGAGYTGNPSIPVGLCLHIFTDKEFTELLTNLRKLFLEEKP